MFKNTTCGIVLLATIMCSSGVVLAEDAPTIDQVYKAAQAGKMDEAQRMMDQVLKVHPESAKAHFIEAELLAKQGQMGRAEAELNNAERLKPGLPFENPQKVQELRNRIASAAHHVSQSPVTSYQPQPTNSFPWGMLLLGLGAIALIVFIMRAMNSRNPAAFPSNFQPGMRNPSAPPMPMQPYGGQPYPQQPYGGGMGPMGASGGIGSGIMGGLATGAAVGVGMVAGEALAHHFMDGDHNAVASSSAAPVADSWGGGNTSYDMGGNDFGMADNSSWSDNSTFADNSSDMGGSDWS